jgi:HEAT repeat protein
MRPALAFALVVGLCAGERGAVASIWPSAAVRVERALADGDAPVRREAAVALGTLPRAAAGRLALAALADADLEVRLAALRVAVRVTRDDLGARLATFLSESDARLRLAAAEALATRPSALALPALGRASSDNDARVRAAVARALGASGSPDAVLPLLGRLDDPSPDVRREVVSALGRLGDRRAVVPLLGKVQDSSGAVRRAAARSLGMLGDARAGSALVLVLRDADPEVRVAALDAVGRLHDASAAASIVTALADADESVRTAAANALSRLGTPAALAALVSELSRDGAEPEPIVAALARAGSAALPVVRACVDTRTALALVQGCAQALARLGDESDGPRVRAALERGVLEPLAGLQALAALGGPAAVPPVLEALSSADSAVRHAALLALGELIDPSRPDGRAVDPLLQALAARGATLAERGLLVRLLGRTGEKRAGPWLERTARESTPPALVAAALLALGDIGPGPWEAVLVDKLGDADGSVRTAAALALRRSGSARWLPGLLERLAHGAEADRVAVGLAIPGVARSSKDPRWAPRLLALARASRDGERDALLEAWAALEAPGDPVASSWDVSDRRKLAEVLAGHPQSRAALAVLARDADVGVRANAAWSLGQASAATDLDTITPLLGDRDAEVAANAAVSLGRVGARLEHNVAARLCPLLADPRAIVREGAVAALGFGNKHCEPGVLERALASDPSPRVRRAAAHTLARLSPSGAPVEALERCAADEVSAEVAAECDAGARVRSSSKKAEPVLVFVVPTGASAPLAAAPFALRFADGSERFGLADRRGAVFERFAPAGSVELGVLPAPGE